MEKFDISIERIESVIVKGKLGKYVFDKNKMK